jgi:hypothetical protein
MGALASVGAHGDEPMPTAGRGAYEQLARIRDTGMNLLEETASVRAA